MHKGSKMQVLGLALSEQLPEACILKSRSHYRSHTLLWSYDIRRELPVVPELVRTNIII